MANALILACNAALALIGKGEINALNEGSLEAAECQRFAPGLLEEMQAWTEWPEVHSRDFPAPVPNDRAAEWLYAYALPNNMAKAVAVRRNEEAATDLPITGPDTFPWQDAYPIPFVIGGGKLYTNVEEAVLVYTTTALTAANLRALARWAFIEELAARLAGGPLKKDAKLAQLLSNKALASKNLAIADAENASPRREPNWINEAEMARAGLIE